MNETLFYSFLNIFLLENPGAEDETEDIRCTTDEIRHIEKELGVILPQHYKTFLERINFFRPINIFRCGKADNILDENDSARDFLAEDLVAFADNGCGDYYCFRIKNGRATDEVLISFHDVERLEHVADDFYSFVVAQLESFH